MLNKVNGTSVLRFAFESGTKRKFMGEQWGSILGSLKHF